MTKSITFTHHTMQEILPILQNQLKTDATVSFEVLNPDLGEMYAGNTIIIENRSYIYRGYKAWTDLAELLKCKMLTPKQGSYPFVTLHFKKLETQSSFHLQTQSPKEEKYGTESHFFQINKMEEPAFFHYYNQALTNVNIENTTCILNLGINR